MVGGSGWKVTVLVNGISGGDGVEGDGCGDYGGSRRW